MEHSFWCPTCLKHIVLVTDSPIICGSPVCAKCNSPVWRKSVEWAKKEMAMQQIKDEEQTKRDAIDSASVL